MIEERVRDRRKQERRREDDRRDQTAYRWKSGGRRVTVRRLGDRIYHGKGDRRKSYNRRKKSRDGLGREWHEAVQRDFGELATAVLGGPKEELTNGHTQEVVLPKGTYLDWAAVYRDTINPVMHGITEDRAENEKQLLRDNRRNHSHWSYYMKATR